jgi:hypothetical protein
VAALTGLWHWMRPRPTSSGMLAGQGRTPEAGVLSGLRERASRSSVNAWTRQRRRGCSGAWSSSRDRSSCDDRRGSRPQSVVRLLVAGHAHARLRDDLGSALSWATGPVATSGLVGGLLRVVVVATAVGQLGSGVGDLVATALVGLPVLVAWAWWGQHVLLAGRVTWRAPLRGAVALVLALDGLRLVLHF